MLLDVISAILYIVLQKKSYGLRLLFILIIIFAGRVRKYLSGTEIYK